MTFYADLHVHSKYSRATSRNCDLEHLAFWARKKGIAIVGTGDFTHPAWRADLKEKLVPAEPGLFRLRPDLERAVEERLPPACRSEGTVVRFMLSVEISTIYKKFDRTRKIHHLIYTPDFDSTDRVVDSLSRIGNLHSDGRPILGLDSRHLLEIALESGPDSYLVPAHIWTPWFAALGSKSGFDAIDECYGDLAPHIFAVETGLSSDPPMNWRVSSLDRFRLVSNSDAHSPEKLGREVCVFDTDLDYFALRRALETGEGYGGTLEFFPEEGKYHLDGHRTCNVRLSPNETREREGLCPACGKPLTVGVMHRVEDLADRSGEVAPPATAGAMQSLIPLPEILSEIHQVGPKSKRVARHYESLLGRLGPELPLLDSLPLEDIRPAASPLLAEAVSRLRRQEVVREAGYDGVYGTIRLFRDAELHRHTRGAPLFGEEQTASSRDRPGPSPAAGERTVAEPAGGRPADGERAGAEPAGGTPPTGKWPGAEPADGRPATGERPDAGPADGRPATGERVDAKPAGREQAPGEQAAGHRAAQAPPSRLPEPSRATPNRRSSDLLAGLDDDQRRAAEVAGGPLLVTAGPGSGKTRTLTHRIAHLVTHHAVPPACCLAITFTRRAAGEMRDRLRALLPDAGEQVPLHTFHSLGLSILREHWNAGGLQRGFAVASDAERLRLLREALNVSERKARGLLAAISHARRTRAPPADGASKEAFEAYREAMETRNLCDFDDLVIRAADALESTPELREEYRRRYRWVCIDEYQDVDEQQVRLVRQLVPPDGNVCAIGDPDQAIYGFRGADVRFFSEFRRDFPGARVVRLTRNYRSDRNIVELSTQVIARAPGRARRSVPVLEDAPGLIAIHEAPTEKAEAEFVVRALEQALGGHSFFSMDSGRSADAGEHEFSFSDFAVLYRTEAQAPALVEALQRSGMPFQQRSHHPVLDHPGVAALLGALREAPDTDPGPDTSPAPGLDPTPDSDRLAAPGAEAAPGPGATPGAEATPGAGATPGAEATPGTGATPDAGTAGSIWKRIEAACAVVDLPAADKLAACELLRPAAEACGGDLERFLGDLSLDTEVDTWDPRADRISLLTLHAAKGLEFPVVFIVGCEDGLLPLAWSKARPEDLEEERRLFYVGVTRARTKLYLGRAKKRLWRGKVRELPPSPWLADIEERLLERRRFDLPPRQPRPRDDQLKLFS